VRATLEQAGGSGFTLLSVCKYIQTARFGTSAKLILTYKARVRVIVMAEWTNFSTLQ